MENYDWEKPQDIVDAIITLYKQQTHEEQIDGKTVELNGRGFNSVDAEFMSSIAKQLIERKFITANQLAVVKPILGKYRAQLGTLQRSIWFVNFGVGIVAPPKNNNGILKIVGDKVQFFPEIYPSQQIKSLGFSWKHDPNRWEGFVDITKIRAVEQMFSPIHIDFSVEKWIQEFEKPVEISSTVHQSSLFEKQKEAVAFMLKCKRGILGLAPGTGKTACSIFAANELPQYDRVLIVSPLTLVRNWQNEIKKWCGQDSVIWHGNVSTWESYDRFVITNYDTLVRNFRDMQNQEFKVVIIDESILLKNRDAKRSQFMEMFSRDCDYVWLLSGSPTSRFLDDMYSQFKIVAPKRFTSYWRFVETYCIKEINQWGTSVVGNKDGAIERIKYDYSDIYFSLAQKDVIDLPDWIFDNFEIPMGISQNKLYIEMEKTFIANLPDGDQVVAPIVLTQLLRLVQFASNPLLLDGPDDSPKWDAVDEILQFEEKPAIIWTNFVRTAELMRQRLSKNYRVDSLTGETPADERQHIVDMFQNDYLDIIVAHPAVGKFGLTLTKARTAIYLERGYNGDDYYQSLYRVRRIGTTQSPHVIHLLSSRLSGGATVDHVIARVLEYRKNNSLAITSGFILESFGKK